MKLNQNTKLSIVVIVIAAALLELTTAVQYFTTRDGISKELTEKAQRDLNESYRIAKLKKEVETAVDLLVPDIKRQIMEVDIDTLGMLLSQLSANQHQIVGVSIGFVPGLVPPRIEQQLEESDKHDGRLGLYVYEDSKEDEGRVVQRSVMHFDYTIRPWYARVVNGHHVTKSGMKGYWSEPYEGNINYVLMCSYSRCLHDADGNAIAVLAADVPLRELSAMATQLIENQQRSIWVVIVLHVLGLLILAFIIYRSVNSIQRLQREKQDKERIVHELSVARDIQQSMIPKTFPGYPDRDDLELYASLTPARAVGGDFYDFIIHENSLCFCVGDVSGKGIPAALLMSVTRSLFRTEAGRAQSACAIVQGMNQTLHDEQSSGYFATMFVGILDLTNGHLDYCNAGHEAPVISSHPLSVMPNLPVGALPDWEYEGQETTLQPDDIIFLYTDGLTEAANGNGQLFTRQRVHEITKQALGASPRQLVELMEQRVRQHAGDADQSDDITLMAIQWHVVHDDLQMRADMDELPRMKDFVVNAAEKAGMNSRDTKCLRLAVEEAVTNVIQYAYDGGNNCQLSLSACTTGNALEVTITDKGKPFNPTTAPMADTTIPADERTEGGLGILLLHRMSDGLDYRREDGCNILKIKKII